MIIKSPYVMSISLNTLNHLGINLYSNVPAVLSELVANAYDADANEVRITITPDTITIRDDGNGMTRTEINERYLTIGYSRRKHQPGLTSKGRPPMGRKGIGKLAVFSIADTVEVYSAKSTERNGLELSRKAITDLIEGEKFIETADETVDDSKQSSEETEKTYRPDSLPTDEFELEHGTLLVLRDLRRKRTATLTVDNLKKRLARRFTVIGIRHKFQVYVNEQEVTPRDRGFYSALEFVWFFGDIDPEVEDECKNTKKKLNLSNLVDESEDYRLKGWIGTVGEPKQLGDRSEEGNSIVVFARGKLVQENILQEIREARVFAQYLVGDIEADFIDLDLQDDLATSDRQRLVADDPRYQKLKSHIERAIKGIGLQWTALRNETGTKRALDNPVLSLWYETLNKDNQKHAKQLFGKIESLPIADTRSKSELYKASILAFEKLSLTGQLSALDEISTEEGFDALLSIFQSVDELEAAHYYEIARGRLKVINKFQNLIDHDSKERVLQQYLFEHLWLLDPSWERATGSERLEQSVKKQFDDVTKKLTEDEQKARIDIRYSTIAGKHVIVELKKYSVRVDASDLQKQVGKYRSALQKMLSESYQDQAQMQIEIVCVLGSAPTGLDPIATEETLKAVDARFITYDRLIVGAQAAYADYLEKRKDISALNQLLDELDNSFED